jgi:hypothetical protein
LPFGFAPERPTGLFSIAYADKPKNPKLAAYQEDARFSVETSDG